jgi:hypothetical protein
VAKWLLALGLAALFGVSASSRERHAHPPLDRLLATPERWEGAEIRVASAVVRDVHPGLFVVEVDGLPLWVRGETAAKAGEVVDLRGTFRARARRLDLASSRAVAGSLIPALVLAWALWNLWRHFKARAR